MMDLEQEPAYWNLSLVGELDFGQCTQFRMNVDRILSSDVPAAIIDMSRLDYIDSSGLGILLAMYKEYTATGRRLVLITNKTVDKLLAILRLQNFDCATDMQQAIRIVESQTH